MTDAERDLHDRQRKAMDRFALVAGLVFLVALVALAARANAGGWGFQIDAETAHKICQLPHVKDGPAGWQTVPDGVFEWCRTLRAADDPRVRKAVTCLMLGGGAGCLEDAKICGWRR